MMLVESGDLALLRDLASGQFLKTVSNAFHEDVKTPGERLKVARFLWHGPAKFKLIGSWSMITMITFILPSEFFHYIMSHKVGNAFPLGHMSVALLGFAADDLFMSLHYVNQKTLRKIFEKLELGEADKRREEEQERLNREYRKDGK